MDENFVYITLPTFAPQSPCTSTIFVVVKAQDNSVRWQRTMAACAPMVVLYLNDGLGNPLNLNPGDTVQATFEGNTAVAVVPTFAVISDPKTSTVAGTTNAPVVTASPGLTQTLAVWPTAEDDYLTWQVRARLPAGLSAPPIPSIKLPTRTATRWIWSGQPGAQGHLRYIDADGNQIYATFAPSPSSPCCIFARAATG